ncbi:hypothetical protein KIN20_003198 [Parelaphostrongylus tenuis]|uniref:Uncharacterized protein n=1 Tax=Parelaphostrongylus tenuis TaxID=148309 RepID=A0AAD5MFB2_PARTN|nr:hypothetical protein KIN20_003198 [Parelaphostrongylus tenuis]
MFTSSVYYDKDPSRLNEMNLLDPSDSAVANRRPEMLVTDFLLDKSGVCDE